MELKGKRVMVIGGAGFIGSHLVDRLVKEEVEILVVDNFSTGKRENLLPHQENGRIEVIEADIRDREKMFALCQGVDTLFHLAVQCLRVSLYDPQTVHEVNATGTLNLLLAARESGVKRFLYVSSSEVYGSAHYVPMDENHPCEPTTVYGASKRVGELYSRAFFLTHGSPVVVVRPFNTYGPREHFEGPYGEVIPRFLIRVLNGKPPFIFGDGRQTRDFTYVTDVAEGIFLAAQCDELVGGVVNIARGEEVSINEIARLVIKYGGEGEMEPEYGEARPADVRRHYADIKKARKKLGFTPSVSIDEGIRRYINWFKKQHKDFSRLYSEVTLYNWQRAKGDNS